jgi:hypothetical protein
MRSVALNHIIMDKWHTFHWPSMPPPPSHYIQPSHHLSCDYSLISQAHTSQLHSFSFYSPLSFPFKEVLPSHSPHEGYPHSDLFTVMCVALIKILKFYFYMHASAQKNHPVHIVLASSPLLLY